MKNNRYLSPDGEAASTHRLIIDGKVLEVTTEELIKMAQKGEAADRRLQEAAQRNTSLDAREAKISSFEKEKADWELVRAGDTDAFRRLAKTNTNSTDEEIEEFIANLEAAKNTSTYSGKSNVTTENNQAPALNARAAAAIAWIEKLKQDTEARGIDILQSLQIGAAAGDAQGKAVWQKNVATALAKHAGLGKIMAEGSPIDRDKLSAAVWKRVEKMVAAGQKPTSGMIDDVIGDTVEIMDITARGVQTHNKNAYGSVPGIGNVPSGVDGLAGLAPTEPPTLDPNDLAGSINRMQAYSRAQGGNDLSEFTERVDYEPDKAPPGAKR